MAHSKPQPESDTRYSVSVDSDTADSEILVEMMDAIEAIQVRYGHKPKGKSKEPVYEDSTLGEIPQLRPIADAVMEATETLFRHERIRNFSPRVKILLAAAFHEIIEDSFENGPIMHNEIKKLTKAFGPEQLQKDEGLLDHLVEIGRYNSIIYDPIHLHDETIPWSAAEAASHDGHPPQQALAEHRFELDETTELRLRTKRLLEFNMRDTGDKEVTFPPIEDPRLLSEIKAFAEHVATRYDKAPFLSFSRVELAELIWDAVQDAIFNDMTAEQFHEAFKEGGEQLKENMDAIKSTPGRMVHTGSISLVRDPKGILDGQSRNQPIIKH